MLIVRSLCIITAACQLPVTEIQAVVWIQRTLELVCREGREGEEETEAGPGPPSREGEDQLESGRDGGNMMRNKEEPIQDVMLEGQWPTECEDCQFIHICSIV
jgi:hypothetical protein